MTGIDYPEYLLAMFMELLPTALKVGKVAGYSVDLDAFCKAVKEEVAQEMSK